MYRPCWGGARRPVNKGSRRVSDVGQSGEGALKERLQQLLRGLLHAERNLLHGEQLNLLLAGQVKLQFILLSEGLLAVHAGALNAVADGVCRVVQPAVHRGGQRGRVAQHEAVQPPLERHAGTLVVTGPSFDDPYANVVGGNPFPVVRSPNMTFPQFASWVTFPLDMKPWYSDQWNVSFQKQLGASWAAAANYVNVRGRRLPIGENLNPAIYQGPASTVANVNQRRKLNIEDPVNGQYFGLVIQVEPKGESKYDALLLSLQHRASSG